MSLRHFSLFTAAISTYAATSTLFGCASLVDQPAPVAAASVVLRDASGTRIGTATLQEGRDGQVVLQVDVAGLAPGAHGIHLHAVGSCAATGSTPFGGAGGHFNPHARSHGLENPQGAHGGDLPNLEVAADGRGRLRATSDRVTLTAGPSSLFDADGAALVIHAGPDDQRSDPTGNSGARVACGVLEAS